MKTLQEVSDRREQEAAVLEQKAAEQRQRVRERLAKLRGGVDVVVDDSTKTAQSAPNKDVSAKGREVDIKV